MLSPSDICKFMTFTGANGVLIARGAIHNPSIFTHKKAILAKINDKSGFDNTLNSVWLENTDKDCSDNVIEEIKKAKI